MEILLWLVPSAVVTLTAMSWAMWRGREGRDDVDREVAIRRLTEALTREQPARPPRPARNARDRSTGIAVRPSHGGDETRRAS